MVENMDTVKKTRSHLNSDLSAPSISNKRAQDDG